MDLSVIAKSAAPYITHYSGIGKALAFRYGGRGTVFGLHSVVGDTSSHPDDCLRCPLSVLERTLSWLRRNRIEIVSLDEATNRLAGPRTDRFCVFTFDDGYADNLTQVLPVMKRFDAPFTVYVTSGMITGEIDAWWLGFAELIRRRERLELAELGRFDCADQASKKRTFHAAAAFIESNPQALSTVRTAISASGIDCGALARAEGLSVDQLRRLAASPLATIGAHGVRHIDLTDAPDGEVAQEMTAGRRFLEDAIQRDVVHFAYPFGACGRREEQLARSAGFRTAATTRRGTLFARHLDHPYALPREPIFGKDNPASLRCKMDGAYRAFHSRLGDPVALM